MLKLKNQRFFPDQSTLSCCHSETDCYNDSDQERTILVDHGEELMDLVVRENNDNDNQGTTGDNNGDA